ncbi:peptidoglycan-associated lipoprotein Pal [Alphaproteobacteria bacterium]|jgi:peptidoglycan-associated lipoprotein|nr:peptidoglycan-associated lipoprotein Pal [Alphaproteobacteria bacterium]
MIVRIITLFAALGLLAACETAPNTSGDADGTGASSSTASSSTASSSADSGSSSEQMTISEELIQIGDRVLFGFDSYELTSDAKSILDNQASFLASNPSVRITIEGHCDERGTREYNLALGESRASATRDYLVAQGVNPARIKIISYGKERPAVIGSNEDAWRFNRRAVSVIN